MQPGDGGGSDVAVRPQVAESWVRSVAAGVRPEADVVLSLDTAGLRDLRAAHPLAAVFPLLDDVLGQAARECDSVMAVSDALGQLLWVCGSPAALRRAERIGFVEGSNWDERVAGTNAPGTALATDTPVVVRGDEHFRRSVRDWSCVAVPIHDPLTHGVVGVLDVTGGPDVGGPQSMAMVRAAARMAEAELAREAVRGASYGGTATGASYGGTATGTGGPAGPRLEVQVLGRPSALVTLDDGRGRRSALRLSPRHSEILLLLACAPAGLSGDQLLVLLYEQEVSATTLRVELGRLRGLLGDELLGSRPYRLRAEVAGDWSAVEAHLATGDVAGALRRFRGPVLPGSDAPGVVRLREQLTAVVRQAVLDGRRADLMAGWTRSAWGGDDLEMWRAQLDAVDPRSPLRPFVLGQLARLDRELGTGPARATSLQPRRP